MDVKLSRRTLKTPLGGASALLFVFGFVFEVVTCDNYEVLTNEFVIEQKVVCGVVHYLTSIHLNSEMLPTFQIVIGSPSNSACLSA